MRCSKDFYVFEVLEDFIDSLIFFNTPNYFYKGERFIGWELNGKRVVKSNMRELVCIPLDKVKKVYKINFEDIK